MCSGAIVPRCQGVVGHIGKVQKWEEVLRANHAKAFGEVRMHPSGKKETDLLETTTRPAVLAMTKPSQHTGKTV
jgi:hypothetical protein